MHPQRWVLVAALAVATGYLWLGGAFVGITSIEAGQSTLLTPALKAGQAVATFASGCFWCTESDFDKLPSVISTTSGYTGGNVANPTYKEVSSGRTGHAEAVQVVYDPAIVTYDKLLDHYWHNVDPFVANRQFCDVGTQYRPVIFFHTEEQRAAAESSKARIQMMFKQPIVVAIAQAGPFYRAEEYHQDYYKKNNAQYRFYRFGCGRDGRLEQIWAAATH